MKPIVQFLLALCAATGLQAEPLRLIALGDMPYGNPTKVYPPYEALLNEINTYAPQLVIHVGDTKSGRAECTDQILLEQLDYMNTLRAPVLYTPGDNEWTDCHRQGRDPLERLRFIRDHYFADPAQTLGQTRLNLTHQGADGFPENARLQMGDVGIITAHVVGSNNGFEVRDPDAVAEFFARSAASTRWLKDGFKAFKDTQAIIVAIHADMFEFDFNMFKRERWLRHSGFVEFGKALQTQARDYDKPILLLFGDSHIHRQFQPFPQSAPNVTAIEVYGARDMHGVEITVDTDAALTWRVETIWNPALPR